MKTNGLRSFVYRSIMLILLSLYFLLVFGNSSSRISPVENIYPVHFWDSLVAPASPQSTPKLLSFAGISSNKQVKFAWTFETTESLDECILERADKTNVFKPVAYFFMTEDIHIPNLHYTDNAPQIKTYSYRLRITSKSGEILCTKPLVFKLDVSKNEKKTLAYPIVFE